MASLFPPFLQIRSVGVNGALGACGFAPLGKPGRPNKLPHGLMANLELPGNQENAPPLLLERVYLLIERQPPLS